MSDPLPSGTQRRQAWMAILARAPAADLARLSNGLLPAHTRLRGPELGHAYCLGRDLQQAELAAALDAALQDPAQHDRIADAVIAPLAAAQQAARDETARCAAATRVQFFTMATMRS